MASTDQENHRKDDWNPNQYLLFRNERTQPSIDLVNRIRPERRPKRILDLGCGPGNSSEVLTRRWPEAALVGVDNSPAMIEKAKAEYPEREWILCDAAEYDSSDPFDIVYSNALIQWIPGHERLLTRFLSLLSARGILAVQVPQFTEMPLGRIVGEVSRRSRWADKTRGCAELFTFHDYRFYHDLLAEKVRSLDMWETDYIHRMESHWAVIEWIRSTGLKPYLERLGDDERADFEREVLDGVKGSYPAQSDGAVLFPFKRLFFIGYW